jgi:hypothetical protein
MTHYIIDRLPLRNLPLLSETNPSLELSDYQPDHQAKSAPPLLRFRIQAKA